MVHEGDDGVGAGVDRRGGGAVVSKCHIFGEVAGACCNGWDFFCAVVGEAQVAQLDGGIAFRGGCGREALLLPAARPALHLNRGGSELRDREVGRDEETCIVVFVNQLDVVDRPSAFLAVLGEFELNLIGAVCAVAADAVAQSEIAPEKFLATRAAEREGTCGLIVVAFLQAAQVVPDCQIGRDRDLAVARVGRRGRDCNALQDRCSEILRSGDSDCLTKLSWNGIAPLAIRFATAGLIILVY